MIKVQNLQFSYKQNVPALDVPFFEMKPREKVFLFGPSGGGKSTFLGCLAGVLDTHISGSIEFLGDEIVGMSARKRDELRGAHMGVIFQTFNLIPYLSVRENIELPLRFSKERRAKIGGQTPPSPGTEVSVPIKSADEIAAHLQIDALLDHGVLELSVGQQQRVAAARALIGAPELIIADEPTSSLDTDLRDEFMRLLLDSAKEASVLFVSHDQSLRKYFDRAVSLHEINRAGGHS